MIPNDPAPLSIRETAKGIAVRAGILSIVSIIVGTWLFSLAAKAASGIVRIFAGILLLAIGGGYAAWQVRKVKRHFEHHEATL
ncbi:MAG TPA: hypothetical protein VM733_04705 [Thermoanaerobaculia bacterium]|nr:hypothetical protein [Thermoanaerobaculia bacterium]